MFLRSSFFSLVVVLGKMKLLSLDIRIEVSTGSYLLVCHVNLVLHNNVGNALSIA